MRSFRFPIAGLMGLVLFLGIGLAGFREGTEIWFRSLYSATVAALLLATLAGKFSRGSRAAFWMGFAICGWAYLLLGLGLNPQGGLIGAGSRFIHVNDFLATTFWIKSVFVMTSKFGDVKQIGSYGYSVAVGHLMATAFLAAVGGAIAVDLHDRRRKKTVGDSGFSSRPSRRGKALWILLSLTAVLLAVQWPFLTTSSGPYFPELAFEKDKAGDALSADSYGRRLRAMKEPSLWVLSRKDPQAVAYRFLWLPSFQHPVSVRAQKNGETANLKFVVCSALGYYEPADVVVSRERTLSQGEWDELERLTERAGFWEMGAEKLDHGNNDGETLLFEGVKGGRYHVVDRSEPEGDYLKLCRYMLVLTGFKFHENWEDNSAPDDSGPGETPKNF